MIYADLSGTLGERLNAPEFIETAIVYVCSAPAVKNALIILNQSGSQNKNKLSGSAAQH